MGFVSVRWRLFAALPFLLIASVSQAQTSTVGKLPGELAVGPSGVAAYTIPIQVPPGRGGLAPQLALTYSGQTGNGLLGIGWSLEGLPSISRCPKTLAQDGEVHAVDLSVNDRFCLDGQRLIAIKGNYGAHGTQYRTEIESFSKIVSFGSAGLGPAWFKVWTKSGEIMLFGNTEDSQLKLSGHSSVLRWGLNKVADTTGNLLKVTYQKNESLGDHYPEHIQYAGGHISMTYEDRPDVRFGYIKGVRQQTQKRLTSITSTIGRVNLRYLAHTAAHQMSRLYQIEWCTADGETCLPPTTFEWQGESQKETWISRDFLAPNIFVTSDNEDRGLYPVDLNGDGLTDMIQGVSGHRQAWLNTGTSWTHAPQFAPPTDFMGSDSRDLGVQMHDLNGDGLPDLLQGHVDHINQAWLNNGNGWDPAPDYAPPRKFRPIYANVNDDPPLHVTELNGDGLPDLLFADHSAPAAWLNTGSGWVSSSAFTPPVSALSVRFSFRVMDFNGDGLTDVLNVPSAGVPTAWLSTGSGWRAQSLGPQSKIVIGSTDMDLQDLNGDGLLDFVIARSGYRKRSGTGGGKDGTGPIYTNVPSVNRAWLNTGNGWIEHAGYRLPAYLRYHIGVRGEGGDFADAGTRFVELNGDGLVDIVQARRGLSYRAWLNTGNGWVQDDRYAPREGFTVDNVGTDEGLRLADIDGDGQADLLLAKGGKTSKTWINTAKPLLLTRITTGLRERTDITYRPLANKAVYRPGERGRYPQLTLSVPVHVVARVETTNGVGGMNATSYRYEGLKFNLRGRGLLGVAKRHVTDEATGITTSTTFNQGFPYTGTVASSVSCIHPAKPGRCNAASDKLLSRSANTYAIKGSVGSGPVFPYAASSTETGYDFTSGRALTTTRTTSTYDAYGNVKTLEVTTTGDGHTYRKRTVNTYRNDTAKWHLGRLIRAQVTSTVDGKSDANATKVSAFAYDRRTGLLSQEIIEPDRAVPLSLTTTYVRDAYGNITQTIICPGAGGCTAKTPGARISTSSYAGNGQHPDGLFPTTSRNSLGHVEKKTYDPAFGGVKTLTGPNGLSTRWLYDGFGRQIKETRSDGSSTQIKRTWCQKGCGIAHAKGVYAVTTQSSGASPTTVYFDVLEREIRRKTKGLTGKTIYVDTVYDALGRVKQVSEPYFVGATVIDWTKTFYDQFGRVIKVQPPHDGDPKIPASSVAYKGYSTITTDALGRRKKTTQNAIGQTIQVTDAAGTDQAVSLQYQFDGQGNLHKTRDSAGNEIVVTYDIRGNKIALDDPDMGKWTYRYNAFGELVRQGDAKGKITRISYDKLGRMIERTDAEGTAKWYYDKKPNGDPVPKGIGKLYQAQGADGYRKTHTYDRLGRLKQTTERIDGTNYTTQRSYDGYSRLSTLTYPRGFAIKHHYNARGYLTEIGPARASKRDPDFFWKALKTNARGQLTQKHLGNGLKQIHSYDRATGHLEAVSVGTYWMAFDYDAVGNLKKREDLNRGLEETFQYDALYRLTKTQVKTQTAKVLRYDALGNITFKTGMGTYHYYGSRPHAVTRAGTRVYRYDANGNQTQGSLEGRTRTVRYTAFNKPEAIQDGVNEVSFTYGPSRSRTTKTVHTPTKRTTTTYVGLTPNGQVLYEQEKQGSETVHNFYIHAGGAHPELVRKISNRSGTQDLYQHRDHLGSVEYITDQVGDTVVRKSHDAWGKRRNPNNWKDARPGAGELHPFENGPANHRCFTNHEALEEVGLIHMNGRAYDPSLGRFLSADPHIQAAGDTQSYNRYSYVKNNPLSYTDPTGFFIKNLFKKIFSAIRKIVRKIGSFLRKYGRQIAAIAIMAIPGAQGFGMHFLQGFAAGLVGSGGDFKAALVGGLTAGFLSSYVHAMPVGLEKVATHALVGGAQSAAMGGSFKDGFLSAGLTQYLSWQGAFESLGGVNAATNFAARAQNAIAAAVVGGTVSALSGGKFRNGAWSAAFSRLFNDAVRPNIGMRTSQIGAQAIAGHEEFVGHIYPDYAGHATIGYGHMLTPAEKNSRVFESDIDEPQALQILQQDLTIAETAVISNVTVPLTQYQFDALVSFTFNLGGKNLSRSTLLLKLNSGNYSGAADEFLRWNKARDPVTNKLVVVSGLTRRRIEERCMFLGGC